MQTMFMHTVILFHLLSAAEKLPDNAFLSGKT